MRRLYSSAIAKKHVFPPECELTLRVWQLHVLTQIELFTDDSFQFTKVSVRGGVRVRAGLALTLTVTLTLTLTRAWGAV